MIESIIRAIKGVLPDSTWDYIFNQFEPHDVRFTKPSYPAVRVSTDYMLVKVPKKLKNQPAAGVPADFSDLSALKIEELLRTVAANPETRAMFESILKEKAY